MRTINKLLNGEKINIEAKYLNTKNISHMDDISFYPPATEIKSFGNIDSKQSISNFVISNIIISIQESSPLYNISRRFINDDTNFPDIYTYRNISDKFMSIKNETKVKKWKLENSASTFTVEKNRNFISATKLLDEHEYLSLNTLVKIEVSVLNNEASAGLYRIQEIRIDEDLNVYYRLSDISDRYYTSEELLIPIYVLGDSPDAEPSETTISKIIYTAKIEI